MCSIVLAHSLEDTYNMMKATQNRGKDSAGIAAWRKDNSGIDVLLWSGSVDRIDMEGINDILPSAHYHTFMGHLRYATHGGKDRVLQDAHPVTLDGTVYDRGSHILIEGASCALVHNGQVAKEYLGQYYTEGENDTRGLLRMIRDCGTRQTLERVPGSFTLAYMDTERRHTVVMRDRHAMRPGLIGTKNGKTVVASEDVAFKRIGAEADSLLKPYAQYQIDPVSGYTLNTRGEAKPRRCFFEANYFSSFKSSFEGRNVQNLRIELGRTLAKTNEDLGEEIDVLGYLPRCPRYATNAFGEQLGIKSDLLFYKISPDRSFYNNNPKTRDLSINANLFLSPTADLQGKIVAIIDDSIVRGTNSAKAVAIASEAGAKKVIIGSYTPPIGIIGADGIARGCEWGVDMPPDDDFIVRLADGKGNRTPDEIAAVIKERAAQKFGKPIDAEVEVRYMDVEPMLEVFESFGLSRDELCTYCIGGKHPFLE